MIKCFLPNGVNYFSRSSIKNVLFRLHAKCFQGKSMSKFLLNNLNKLNHPTRTFPLAIITHQENSIMALPNNNNSKENPSVHLVKNLLRKEYIKMMKFIIESKNNDVENNKSSRNVMNTKIKRVMKSLKLHPKTSKHGMKSFPSINLKLGQSQKRILHQVIPSIKSLKTQVLLVPTSKEIMKSPG